MPTTRKARVLTGTPASLGYRFPAEWEPQASTWFSWPRPEGISFPGKYHTIPDTLAKIIRAIVAHQRVDINVPNENYRRIVEGVLLRNRVPLKNVRFHFIKTNESWCRDHGPAFVVKASKRSGKTTRRLAIVDWGFNAWGGKYPPYDDDDQVPTRVAEELGLPVCVPSHKGVPVVMEGGAVEFNGKGTVLTTESCLLNPNRNPGMTKRQIETCLKDYYGQTHVCWLGDGIVGDDTDGHIDDLARFLNPRTIVIGIEPDPRDANFKILRENHRRATLLKNQDGRPFDIVTLPMPGVVEHAGERLPATYLNFLFVNGAVLVPTFRHRTNDRAALAILRKHLPRHEVIGIDCTELIWGLGAIHCLTQQQPKGA